MILKELIITNYQCYYGDKKFEFVKGSNIVLGKNGGGKTKFYEALEWLFDPTSKKVEELVSKKKLHETPEGGVFKVGVEATFQQDEILSTVKKYFSVQKRADRDFASTNIVYEGIVENAKGERDVTDGQNLLNRLFPPTNRRYCMFKGESNLNILNNEDALLNLINLYSKVKHFKPYEEKGKSLKEYADKAVEEAAKKDKKNEKRYKELEGEILGLQKNLNDKEIFLRTKYDERSTLEENIQGVERHLENAEAVETIRKRISDIDESIQKLNNRIDEDYTTCLFDKNWLLIHFESIQKEFSGKVKQVSANKRKLQKDYDIQLGIKEGERRAQAALFKDVMPLPKDVPSKAVMEEMLQDEICKVCNREAKKGTPPYEFMLQRLKDYLTMQEPSKQDEDKEEELFKHNYISRLVSLETTLDNSLGKIRSIEQTIKDQLEFNRERKNDIANYQKKREKEVTDLENVIGSSELGQDNLSQAYKNYKGWQRDLTAVDQKIVEYENNLREIKDELSRKREEKEKIDRISVSTYLTNTRKVLRDIEKIFCDTKESKYDDFVNQLEVKSNKFLKKINTGSFTGYIKINRKKDSSNKEKAEVVLMQDGERFYHPNTSLQTSMHLAILFAIAEMTELEKEESFPMIFDAPTSSFDPIKRRHFFEVLGDCNEQTILLTKDFTDEDEEQKGLLYSEEFTKIKRDKAILIKLEEPFDNEVLSTINTQIINL